MQAEPSGLFSHLGILLWQGQHGEQPRATRIREQLERILSIAQQTQNFEGRVPIPGQPICIHFGEEHGAVTFEHAFRR